MQNHNAPGQRRRSILDHLKSRTLADLIRDWKWIFGFSRAQTGAIVLSTCFGLLSSALGLGGSLVSKYLVDAIGTGNSPLLSALIPVMLIIAVLNIVFHALNSQYAAKLGVNMQNLVHKTVFDRLLRAKWLELSRFSAGDLLNRFSADVNTVAGCAVSFLPGTVTQLFSLAAALGIIVYYDPMLALIGCAGMPVLFFLSRGLMRRQREHNQIARQISSELSAFESEVFQNLDTLKSFGVEDHIIRRLEEHQNRYRNAVLDFHRYSVRAHGAMSAANTTVQYLALGYCLLQLWNGKMDFGSVVLFLQLRSVLQGTFSSLANQIPRLLTGSVAAERLRVLTELPPEAPRIESAELPRGCTLRVQGVTLGYSDGRVLHDVSFHAGPGEIIALTGPSGQGKTTLLRLLLGHLPPEKGQAYLQAADGTKIPIGPATRHAFSCVPQGKSLLAGSVEDNLRLAAPDASEEDMIRALRLACAWDFVEKLPQGIRTPLGDGGKGLSQGQAQRLAIARALLRSAPFLLLDEVTSALDMETEEVVLKNLSSLGLTCVVTTHRPSVLKMCSRVYRVEGGALRQLSEKEIRKLQWISEG